MKTNHIYLLFALLGMMVSACSTPDIKISGNDTPPAGSLPSEDFTLNNLPAEPYADDAVRIVAPNGDAPFYSLELMADGHYLMMYSNNTNRKPMRTRGEATRDGSVNIGDGLYGSYTKLGDSRYGLDDGSEIDLGEATGSDATMTYTNKVGIISTVYVQLDTPNVSDQARSLCRSWDMNSFELWAYFNGKYIAHGKQSYDNGKLTTTFKALGDDILDIEEEDYLGDDSEFCYKVIFTTAGTYLCFYLNGDVEVSRWKWLNESQGTLYYDHSTDGVYEGDGYVTVRFAGKQMRVYEDYTDSDDGDTERLVIVNTLTASE